MKKPIRLISLLLAMVLCFSCMSIGVQALHADYEFPAGKNALDHYVISAEQCASMILDKIDYDVLGDEEKAKKLKGKIDVPGWLEWICDDFPYDLTSVDNAFDTLIRLYDSDVFDLASKLDLGDLQNIKIDDIKYGRPTRTSSASTDLGVLNVLFRFLRTNKTLIGKIVDGEWDNGGIVSYFIDVNETVGNVHQKIKDAAYNALFPNPEELPTNSKGEPVIQATSTLDAMVNFYVSDLLGGDKIKALLPSLQDELGADFNLNQITIYELLRKVLRTAINDYARPLLTDLFIDNEEIWPILTGLLGMEIEETDAAGNPRPKETIVQEMVDDLLDFKNGVLSQYIKVEDTGISVGPNFNALVNQLMDTARGLMGTLGSFDTVEMIPPEELSTLSNPEMLAYIGRTLLLTMVDYMEIPLKMPQRDADGNIEYVNLNGYGLMTYALINVMLDKMPEKDYYGMIDNYINDSGSEDEQLNPGQVEVLQKDPATGRVTVYKEPAAFTILADYLYYYLNAKTTMEIPEGLNFDETLQWIFIWAVNQWGGLVRTDNLNLTTRPDMRDLVVWKNLDALLWDNVLNINWLPSNFGSSFKTVSNGVTTYTGAVTRKVLLEDILYPVVSFNLNNISKFLEVFNMNPDGELNENAINFILIVLKRLLNGMFQSTDRLFGGTTITKLEDIVDRNTKYDDKTNLRIIAENLCTWIPDYGEAILRSALPLIAESLANMGGDRVDKHNYDVYPPETATYSIDYLRQLMEIQRPSNKLESDMMTDSDYFFFGAEDFTPLYRFYNYRETYRKAQTLIEMYDNEAENDEPNYIQYQEDINTLTYRLEYYFDRLSLRDPVIVRMKERLDSAIDRFGYGARGSSTASGTEYNSEQFTLRTWNAYQKAVDFARSVYAEYLMNDSGTLHQSKITAARRLLIQAEKGLKLMGGEADYTVLTRLISLALSELNAGAADPGLYIEHTLQSLNDAYQAALGVDLGYDDSDQDVIDEAAENLEFAIDGLRYYPQFVKVANKPTVLDKRDWTIYGVAEGLSTYFSYVTNLGSGSVDYHYTKNGTGTGTEIFIEDDNGNELQTYTIIVYGDVDGDSYADATDANIVYAYCAGLLQRSDLDEFAFRAADADADELVDSQDAYFLRRAGLKQCTVDQRGVL